MIAEQIILVPDAWCADVLQKKPAGKLMMEKCNVPFLYSEKVHIYQVSVSLYAKGTNSNFRLQAIQVQKQYAKVNQQPFAEEESEDEQLQDNVPPPPPVNQGPQCSVCYSPFSEEDARRAGEIEEDVSAQLDVSAF